MGRKGRHSAKTGDQKLYASRARQAQLKESAAREEEEDEAFLRLDDNLDADDSSDDEDPDLAAPPQHHVLDLGAGDEDEDEVDSDEDESSTHSVEDPNANAESRQGGQEDDTDAGSSSSDEEEGEDLLAEQDPRYWGKKKSAYYHGDTADLEIGQEEDDAFVEEEAARQVQKAQLQDMQEDDFLPSDDEADEPQNEAAATNKQKVSSLSQRDISQLKSKEKRKLLKLQHPELLPVTEHFAEILQHHLKSTKVATETLCGAEPKSIEMAESVGTTKAGKQFLLTKSLMEQSAALNVALYLLLKTSTNNPSQDMDAGDHDPSTTSLASHPVMMQLQKCNSYLEKLEESILANAKDLPEQISNIVQGAALMNDMEDQDVEDAEHLEDETSQEDSDQDEMRAPEDDLEEDTAAAVPTQTATKNQKQGRHRQVLEDARFGLRPLELRISSSTMQTTRKRRKAAAMDDLGDEDDAPKGKALASVINSIDQRSRKKNKRAVSPEDDDMFGFHDDDNDEVGAGVRRMENALEGHVDFDEEMGINRKSAVNNNNNKEEEGFADFDEDDDNDDKFYQQMASQSKKKKALKQQLHQVAPKFPTFEGEVDGERAVSQSILKNRGLVPHRSKLNRNPRVKKRMQYRKALIRRKGAVREIRTDEAHNYEGEGTGIKTRVARSRKLVS